MDNRFHINHDDPMPIYAQLERAVRFAIATEKLRVGEQLPTVRQLAIELKINANTVARVYAELERIGVVETRRGVGTFVRTRQNPANMREMRNERDRELKSFIDRTISEAHGLGFSIEELADQLRSRRKKGV